MRSKATARKSPRKSIIRQAVIAVVSFSQPRQGAFEKREGRPAGGKRRRRIRSSRASRPNYRPPRLLQIGEARRLSGGRGHFVYPPLQAAEEMECSAQKRVLFIMKITYHTMHFSPPSAELASRTSLRVSRPRREHDLGVSGPVG